MENTKNLFYMGKVKAYNDGVYRLTYYTEKRTNPLYFNQKNLTLQSCSNLEEIPEEIKLENLKISREKHMWEVKSKLKDYARNNYFDHFWTLTFDPKKCGTDNSYRFDEMKKWLESERKKALYKGVEFRYIFVPEYHNGDGTNNGTIHWHGVTGGYTPELLDSGKKFRNTKVYNCTSWQYGFSNVQKVRSRIKVANYISKYITKDLMNSPARKGKKKYWCSKNLQLPKTKYIKTELDLSALECKFECDVCKIYEFKSDVASKLHLDFKE